MDWFENVFIPSMGLEADGASRWITEKQVYICLKYMKACPYRVGYYIYIGEWMYHMTIMKKGYGRLTKSDRRRAYL